MELAPSTRLLIQAFERLRIYDYRPTISPTRLIEQQTQLLFDSSNDTEFQQLLKVIRPFTNQCEVDLHALFSLARHACLLNLPGNFVQYGVSRGLSTVILACALRRYSTRPRLLYLVQPPSNITGLDSYKGEGNLYYNIDKRAWNQRITISEQDLERICAQLDISDIIVTTGKNFQDAVSSAHNMVGMIALLHFHLGIHNLPDHLVNGLYDQLSDNAIVCVDGIMERDIFSNLISQFLRLEKTRCAVSFIDEHIAWFTKPIKFLEDHFVQPSIATVFQKDDHELSYIPSQMAVNERFQIYYVSSRLLDSVSLPVRFIEIGSYAGSSLMITYRALKGKFQVVQGFAIEPSAHPQFFDVVKTTQNEVTHLNMKSAQAAHLLRECFETDNNLASLILIDGDHSYDAAHQDILNYFPLLAPGGIMLFHDFLPSLDEHNRDAILVHHAGKEPGVRRACCELMEYNYCCEVLDIPLLHPTDPTQSQSHLPIIPGVYSTIRAYRKLF